MTTRTLTAAFSRSYKGAPLVTIDHLPGDGATFSHDELNALVATLIRIADDSPRMDALLVKNRAAMRGHYPVEGV